MADSKLVDLTEATHIAETDLLYVSSGGVSKKVVGGKFNSIKLSNSGFTSTLQSGTLSGNVVHTLPTTGGNLLSDGKPCFSTYIGANQSISAATFTKVNFDTVVFDTTLDFNTTADRFVPSVAGYYQVNALVSFGAASGNSGFITLYKNGLAYIRSSRTGLSVEFAVNTSAVVYMNGTTDYIEVYVYSAVASTLTGGISTLSCFQAYLISGV